MSPRGLSVFLVPLCWFFVSVAQERTEPAPGGPAAPKPAVTNSSGGNHTHGSGDKTADLFSRLNVDSSMIQRALYVLIGITMIGVLYFLIRAVRLKKPTHRKKYGLLSNYDDSVEMEAVDSEEDDTLYDARSLRR
ncbi:protein FAM174C [Echeneis naucrates]|uniref:Uncharacterized protein n=1 Tax=Echeneis naucrates TaxID=173247 RepID=A0A665U6I3_ECHNA|nr:uncharacterized membrane protein C19orf24 homolog [Echeneis naucrates]